MEDRTITIMTSTYTVTRSTTIDAPPDTVYAEIIDFHNWQEWSPWEDLDPQQNRTFSGAAAGPGAKYGWKGNRKVGEGTMEITHAQQPTQVVVDLRFIKPFRSSAETTFDIRPEGDGSAVTWRMEGPKTLMSRLVGVVKSMDAMVGPDFEKGLARLKKASEQRPS